MHTQTQSIPRTVAEFVQACVSLDFDGIYTLFEDVISQELRDELYSLCPEEEKDYEPCRGAMNFLGRTHNVQSLRDY